MMSLYDESGFDTSEEKLPTLRQYIKNTEGKKIPKLFMVTVIWVPNKFPSFSLECDLFRVAVPTKSVLGKTLLGAITSVVDSEFSLMVSIESGQSRRESLVFSAGKAKGYWDTIGQDEPLGYRFVAG